MVNDKYVHTAECRCFMWSPVVVGALVAIGLSFLLNLFSVAIGLTAFTTNSEGVETLAFAGLIATALGLVVSMFASGWLSGYLGSRYCGKRHIGALYGFLTWCLALVLTIFLAAHAAKYVNFYTHFISGTGGGDTLAVSGAGVTEASRAKPSENPVVISSYIVFCLFFLGALAASIGGHVGMRHLCKEELPHTV